MWFCKYADIIGCVGCGKMLGGNPKNMKSVDPEKWYANDVYYINDMLIGYYVQLYHTIGNNIQSSPVHSCKSGGENGSHEFSDKIGNNLVDTKEHLTNWKHFVFNNKLPMFLNICLTIDQNNNSKEFIPWLVDKQYTDEEINQMFSFTPEEISFIDKTLKKFERYSPWFKRYMCGKDSVSSEEVQKNY